MRSQQRAFPAWQLGMLAVMLLAVGAMLGHPANAQNAGPAEPVAVQPVAPAPAASPEDEGELIPTRDVWEIMQKGGLLMWPIAFCSLVFVAFFFERLVSLRRSRIIPKPFVTRFLSQLRDGELDREQALRLCEENGSPVSQVFAGAVRKWGRPAVEVEQAVIDAGERATNGLRRYLRVFNTVATVTPLLGLLGTVVGMIRAFNSVAASDALGRPELLASGISEALLTTAAGLTVAIPALTCQWYFVSRVDRLIIEIDNLGQQIVNQISAEELQHKEAKAKAPKPRRSLAREAADQASA